MSKFIYSIGIFSALMAAGSIAGAQNPISTESEQTPSSHEVIIQNDPGSDGKTEGLTQRIQINENEMQINELRVRGETQSIEVKPQGNMPAYEVIPETGSHPPGKNNSEGQRVWRVLNF